MGGSARTGVLDRLLGKGGISEGIRARLNYQVRSGTHATGRYIGVEDRGDLQDVMNPADVFVRNGRLLNPPPNIHREGFELARWKTEVRNFSDDGEVKGKYYEEMEALIQKTTGARRVLVFDHTRRASGGGSLNTLDKEGASAGIVFRVHNDYTEKSAPNRVRMLSTAESYTGFKLTEKEYEDIISSRYSFINVWRSIGDEPVQRDPFALCDARTVEERDRFIYEMRFPDRTGENYSLEFSPRHEWFYFPRMVREECVVFKVFDQEGQDARFVFHTGFHDPTADADAPTRESIEVRTIAVW